jgi:pimeloyl-ACP methyl ester carboxylesterase
VTTTLDNSMWSQNVFSAAELIEAGEMAGPRTFSTGDPLYSGDGTRQNEISSYVVAEQNVSRLASWGAPSIKSYQQPRRDQRQWIADAARKRGLKVTGEGGDLEYNLSLMMDGQTGWKHPLSYAPIYSDVAKFFGRTKAVYSATFVVGRPAVWNEEYFWQESEIWKDPKQQRFLPSRMLVPHTRRRPQRPLTDYGYPLIAQGLADIIAEGGQGAIGSHGQHHGLGSLLSYSQETTSLVPILLSSAAGSNLAPLAAQFLIVTARVGETMAEGMGISVVCSEDFPFFEEEAIAERNRDTYLGALQTDSLKLVCPLWPRGVVPEDFKSPVQSTAPVLLLSGEADPVTPPENGELTAYQLGPEAALHLVANGQGHIVIHRGCIPGLASDFIESGSLADLDTSCVGEIAPQPFFLSYTGPTP